MPQKRKSKRRLEGSARPKSDLAVDRCTAGRPAQIRLEHPEGLIGSAEMEALRIRAADEVYRCVHCGVVYIGCRIPGMERILGIWAPQGFVVDSSYRKKATTLSWQ
jgi:hypothetical protein